MDKVGVVDVGFTYFGDDPVQCAQLRCAIDIEPGPGDGEVLLAEMTFTGEQRVLFDPWWDAFRVPGPCPVEWCSGSTVTSPPDDQLSNAPSARGG